MLGSKNSALSSTAPAPVALIFGAGKRRLGYCIAKEAARRGYRVAITFRSDAAEAESIVGDLQKGGAPDTLNCKADVASEGDIRSAVQATMERWERIDLAVTAASIWEPASLQQTSEDLVRRHFEVNTLGTLLAAKLAGEAMIGQPSGGCITLLGDWAISRPYSNYLAYFASKGSLPAITAALAVELAAKNPEVRVNCIHPGPVMVPDSVSPEEQEAVRRRTLVKRLGTPDHIAQAVFALADNDYITGVTLPVDGGRTVHTDE